MLERITAIEQAGEETQESVADVLAEVRALRAEVAALRQPPAVVRAAGGIAPRTEPGT